MALPEAEAIGIIEISFGIYVVINRAVRVVGVGLARGQQPLHKRVLRQGFFLGGE